MLKIKEECVRMNGHVFDYELEDGTLLHHTEWNGEVYTVKEADGSERTLRPVYDDIGDDQYEIIGFED